MYPGFNSSQNMILSFFKYVLSNSYQCSGAVAQLVKPFLLSERNARLNPGWGSFWMELACSLHACMILFCFVSFSEYSSFLPHAKNLHADWKIHSTFI